MKNTYLWLLLIVATIVSCTSGDVTGSRQLSPEQKRLEKRFSSDQLVTRNTPRAWIALSDDDQGVPPANGVNYYTELYRHDVPASLHVYPDGGHGWGSSIGFKYHIEMIMELKAWLNSF